MNHHNTHTEAVEIVAQDAQQVRVLVVDHQEQQDITDAVIRTRHTVIGKRKQRSSSTFEFVKRMARKVVVASSSSADNSTLKEESLTEQEEKEGLSSSSRNKTDQIQEAHERLKKRQFRISEENDDVLADQMGECGIDKFRDQKKMPAPIREHPLLFFPEVLVDDFDTRGNCSTVEAASFDPIYIGGDTKNSNVGAVSKKINFKGMK